MNIAVLGTGYVGLVTGTCFAELGNQVTCIDIDPAKIQHLNQGILPIYEPGLEALLHSNSQAHRLHFANSLSEVKHSPDVIFIAVGTPSTEEGAADLQYVEAAARDIGHYITDYCVIVDKSTVPVGVGEVVSSIIADCLQQRELDIAFDVVSNPEFLREGAAIQDFMSPDRVIIGNASGRAKEIMLELYIPIMRSPEKIFFMSVKDAEMTKYVANAMLATRISFMNEMALLCERMDVDIENVRMGIGSDSRIGNAFIYPGCGYGGSCFPKDVKALIHMAQAHGVAPLVLSAVEERNARQKKILAEKITRQFGEDLTDKTIAIWGLSFKPGTDDLREASSQVLIENLLARNAIVKAYDPVAMPAAKKAFPLHWFESGSLLLEEDQYEVLNGADALVLVTEWKPFCYPDLQDMRSRMRTPVIFDGRNQYDPKQLREASFEYYGIGR